jgi:hypothetical protein
MMTTPNNLFQLAANEAVIRLKIYKLKCFFSSEKLLMHVIGIFFGILRYNFFISQQLK